MARRAGARSPPTPGYAVMLVRAGAFRRQASGLDGVIDASGGMVSVHGVLSGQPDESTGRQR